MERLIKAVLFDIGGPIDTEEIMDREIDYQIKKSFRSRGVPISDIEYCDANQWAINSFAPKTYHAIIWKLADGDLKLSHEVEEELIKTTPKRNTLRNYFEIRDGIKELLASLMDEGILLGLAANQPETALKNMEQLGILHYFKYREVSGSINLRKPDPRLLLHTCKGLGINPSEAIMVGDRIDNDIVPARILDMVTIRFVSGRHASQKPRSWNEIPHADVTSVFELTSAIQKFLQSPPTTIRDHEPE